jgi:hypothetical protein
MTINELTKFINDNINDDQKFRYLDYSYNLFEFCHDASFDEAKNFALLAIDLWGGKAKKKLQKTFYLICQVSPRIH